jgi:hypothetical protein
MRVYVPATLGAVADLVRSGSCSGPVAAYAVTQDLRGWADGSGGAPSDDEELELVALSEAARGSLRLVGQGSGGAVARRVVLAADVPEGLVRVDDRSDAAGPGQVTVTEAVPLAWIRACHVDDAAAEPAVRAAAAAVSAADAGDAAAERVVAELDGHELAWYAPEELDDLGGPRT